MKRFAAALCLLAVATWAQAAEISNGWVTHFYQTRDLSQFDSYWATVVAHHMLGVRNQSSPVVGFSSQVFHQHPELLKGHIDQLTDFSAAEQPALLELLWLTDTDEARAVLSQAPDNPYAGKRSRAVGDLEIKTGQNLDLCWGWYFATGDTAAVDRIISALAIGKDWGALKRYPTSQKTEADKAAAMKDAVCSAAMWSLRANGRSDPVIARHIRMVFFNQATSQALKPMLTVVFAGLGDVSKEEWESEGGPALETTQSRK